MISSGQATRVTLDDSVGVPLIGQVMIPLMVVSFMMINALAVTSITTERDGRALDLLMVTDISPREFFVWKDCGRVDRGCRHGFDSDRGLLLSVVQ